MKFDSKNKLISFSPQLAILWYSIISSILSAGLIAFVVISIESEEQAHIDRVTESVANGVKTLLEKDLRKQISSLSELANLYTSSLSISPSKIPDNDNQYDYQATVWIDKFYEVHKITPIKNKQLNSNFDLALTSLAHSAEIKTKTKSFTDFVITLHVNQSDVCLGIFIPVYKKANELEGGIGRVFSLNTYINKLLPSYLLVEHQLTLFIDDKNVYSDATDNSMIDTTWRKQASFELLNQTWRIVLAPKSDFLSKTHFRMMTTLIFLGVLLSVFFGVAVCTALFAVNQANKIRSDRKKMKQLLKNLPGMAYQALNKKDWPMTFVSDGCEKLTGHPKLEFEQHNILWGSIIHPDDYERVYQTVNNAVKSKSVFEIEYRILTKNNDIKFVWEKGESILSSHTNDFILEGFISDITSIKQVEFDLIDSDAFSNTIVNSVVEAVITIDKRGMIKSFNNAAQIMFGYTFDEIKDQALKILMPKSYHDNHDDYLTHYIETNQAHIIGSGRELLAKRKDGQIFPIHISVSEFKNHENRMFVGVIRDITQQIASQEQRRLHTEQLAHADRLNALGEMAAGMAHEINQPLTAISLYSQTAKNFCENNQFDKLPSIFEKISQHSRRAGAVLESVQIMTRQGERLKEVVKCKLLIDEVIKLAELEAKLYDIKIEPVIANSSIKLVVDRVQIQQVILNLLRNAMEAMQSIGCMNGSTITLTERLKKDNFIEIAIADTGCGLAEKMIENLFTPFSSTKQNGTGIGLSISKRIIEEHNGQIDYIPNKPFGAIFLFTLPINDQGNLDDKCNEK
jgi:two-component system sensor kinase FixL